MILKRHWSHQHNDHFSESRSSKYDNSRDDLESPAPKSKATKKKSSLSNNSPRKSTSALIKNKSQNDINIIANSSLKHNNKSANSLSIDKAQSEVKMVSRRLKEAYSIHLTLDIFNPKKCGKTFGIITAHSLSDTLEMKSVLLEYKHLPYPDDSGTIYEFLRLCFNKFSIREKIVSIASNSSETIAMALHEIDKRFKISKNFNLETFHIKCFPTFVHLNVNEVLRSQETLIDSIRKVVNFTNNNNITIGPMESSQISETSVQHTDSTDDNNTSTVANSKVTGLKLPYDNKNSWNTTYIMIDVFFQQRSIIEQTLHYLQNSGGLIDVPIDWDRLYTLIQLLKPFYEVLHKFSADNYTPVSLVAVCIPHLMDHLSNSQWAFEDLMVVAHNFRMQLETYRQEFQSDTTVIAGLLDSRVKDSFVSPEGRDNAIDLLKKKMEVIKQKNESYQGGHHKHGEDSLWSRIFKPAAQDEIEEYLQSPREHGYANNNAFWEAHKLIYPNLYVLAKTLACVQATSVNGDRMFSAAENLERERRIQVDSTNSKELMKSWAKYLEK